MKKRISYILVTVILVLQFCGCDANANESSDVQNTEMSQNSIGLDDLDVSVDPESAPDALAVLALGGKDNSLDAYSATINAPLQVEKPDEAVSGGASNIFLGKFRAYYFKKHLFKTVEQCWDELAFSTAEGEKGAEHFDRDNQLWNVGPVCGTDHYIASAYALKEGAEDDYRYFLVEKDENHETLREIPLDFLDGSDFMEGFMSIQHFAMDGSGIIHLVRNMGTECHYLLLSPDGEILSEYTSGSGYVRQLVPLYDGRIAFLLVTGEGVGNQSLQCMDTEKGRTVSLAAMEKENYCFTLLDGNTLLYADHDGVYRSSLSGNNPEPLYLWVNHGILLSDVSVMQADEEGRISLIYEDSTGSNYLCLEPTTEKVEVRQITLALSPYNSKTSFYQTVAAKFNRRYPACHIEVKSDYEETALLTELIAGNGPVLIDGFLTGFEEQEKLWEPLDEVMEQLGVTEELLSSVLELGKINGILYGVVVDFELNTVVTGDTSMKDWDYDIFLQCVEDRPELEAIFNLYGGDYGTYFITNFISHGIEDNYLMDVEAGTTNFNSSGFRKALELAKKYCVRNDRVEPGRTVLTGEVLCNELVIKKPEHLALYRACYGEDINYIGYPAKAGAVHFISNSFPLVVRRTASKEEKELACAFIQMCLSYECQSEAAGDVNFGLSVRKDVLEEQINAMNTSTSVDIYGFEQIVIGDNLNIELDGKTLHDLLDKAKPKRYYPEKLSNILYEELEAYFADAITEDMLIEHLESRVGLYLDERK